MTDTTEEYNQIKVARGEDKCKKLEKETALLSKRVRVCDRCYREFEDPDLSDEHIRVDALHQKPLKGPGPRGGPSQKLCEECRLEKRRRKDAERKKAERQAIKKVLTERQDCVEYEECLKYTPDGLPEQLGCEDCDEYHPQ